MSSPSSITAIDQNAAVVSSTDLAVVDGYVRPTLGKARKSFMLFLFCFAEFMDAFIASALFPAIGVLEKDLNIGDSEITWAFAAYSATFAAFLLISGRISDVYSARSCFIVGAVILGAFSLGGGFSQTKVALFILRAFAGIGAAMTVPSALSLIIEWFPEPAEQNQAIAFFGGSSGLGNILGIILGGIFVQWATWRWILYFTGILGLGIAVASILVVPQSAPRKHKPSWKRLDAGAVSLITAALILFVYAVTSGPVNGWGSANVIAPLVIALFMTVVFFVYEAKIEDHMAALPPRVWLYHNVPILVAVGLIPFFWWCQLFFNLMPRMQGLYGWSAIMTSVRFLPCGLFGAIVAGVSANFVDVISPKYMIMVGLTLEFVASMLLPFADTSAKYWSHLFPAFIIGTIGTMIVYNYSNIAVFKNTPPEMAGVVGGLYNAALQIGIALGLAVQASIFSSITKKKAQQGDPNSYDGTRDAFWFTVALVAFMFAMVTIFYKVGDRPATSDTESGSSDEKRDAN